VLRLSLPLPQQALLRLLPWLPAQLRLRRLLLRQALPVRVRLPPLQRSLLLPGILRRLPLRRPVLRLQGLLPVLRRPGLLPWLLLLAWPRLLRRPLRPAWRLRFRPWPRLLSARALRLRPGDGLPPRPWLWLRLRRGPWRLRLRPW